MVLETNPFTLCCIENKTLFTRKQKQSKSTDTFFCIVLVIIAVWCYNKRFQRIIIPTKTFQEKDFQDIFKAFNPEKSYRKPSETNDAELMMDAWLLQLMETLRPELHVEFNYFLGIPHLCPFRDGELQSFTQISIPKCSSFIYKWSHWLFPLFSPEVRHKIRKHSWNISIIFK